jgi:hypothetical protein
VEGAVGHRRGPLETVLIDGVFPTAIHGAPDSTKEYKKVRVRYFTVDEEAWETGHR